MPDIIITPSSGKLEFLDNSTQTIRRHAFTLDHNDGIKLDAPLSAAAVIAPLNVINVTVNNSNVNYPLVLASGSAETGTKTLMMDGSGGTYNPFTNTATIDISGNSATTTLASNSTNLGGVAAASYVTLTGTQTLTNKTITGTFTGNLTGTGSWATNAVNANTATNSTQLNGQAASYYTNIPARLGYTPVNKAGDTISGNLTVNGNFAVNGSVTAFSASNIYITSSNLTVTDNILLMNALSPYQRYAGIQMYDSGSGTLSQFLWDGEGDYFFLTGSSVNGKIITGPDGQTNLSSNYVPKATAGYKLGNSLLYDNGTNVGIGTTIPADKLQVGAGHISIDAGYKYYMDANVGAVAIRKDGTSMVFTVGANDRVYIDNTGSVGIGTSSPVTKLHVVGVISGSSFSGAGTGLTGTAASLSIGGNAATATRVNGTNGQLLTKDIRAIAPNNIAAGYLQFGFTTWTNTLSTTPYADYLHLRSYTDSSGGNDNLVMFRKDAIGMRIWQQTFGSASNYSTYKDVAFTDQIGNGTITIAAGTGVGVGTTNTFTTNQSGATTVTITNTGVTSNVAGTGISVSGATGAVTITNSGVTSAVAGTGVGVSGATGAVTFSIGQAVGTGNSPTFAGATINGQLQVNNATPTSILRIFSGGSTAWNIGVGDSSGTNFNITADFGSILINKSTGNIWISGSGINNTVLHSNSTLTAGNLSGTIPSGVLGNSTHYVGTTAIALNRGSASQTLTGVSIDGNAATVGTLSINTSGRNNVANQIVRTDSNGYIQAGWINTTSGDQGTSAIDRVYASYDGYIRYYTPANFRTVLDVPTRGGSGASGNWGINVTGTAASETLSTVTGRGNGTGTQIIVATAAGQAMYIGRQAGAGYSYGSAGIFTALSDNPNGGSNIFYQGYISSSASTPGGILTYSVRADGQIYTTMNTATGIANNSFSVAKTVLGTIHIANGSGTSGNNRQAAITFQGDSATEAQAGIYVSNNNSSGTAMGFATTDSYGTGPQLFMTATNAGVVNFSRARPTYAGNALIDVAGGQTIAGITYFSNGESMNVYGIRGRFTNEYLHLYNKVGVGHPGGWGQGEGNTPSQGLSTYGGISIAYGTNATSIFYGNVGVGTTSVSARVESYYSSNAITFNYLATNLNNNSPIPVYGFDVTNGSGETRSIKAGIGYERHLVNGRGTLHFYNDSTNDTQSLSGNRTSAGDIKMSIDNAGNVGIGTTIPSWLLTVYAASAPQFTLQNGTRSFVLTNNSADNLLSFNYNSANRLQFDLTNQWFNTGNLGIGTTSPSALLNVRASAPAGTGTVTTGTNILIDSNTNNYITFRNTADNGTYAGLVFLDNNVGGYIAFGNAGAAVGSDSMIYGAYQDHIFQNSYVNETLFNRTETMRIKQSGNVGIGTSNPGRKLDVEGIVRTRGASGTGGFEISAASSGAAKWRIEWDSASDSLDFNWVG